MKTFYVNIFSPCRTDISPRRTRKLNEYVSFPYFHCKQSEGGGGISNLLNLHNATWNEEQNKYQKDHIEHWKTDALYLLRAILMIYSFYLPTFLIMGSIATEKADQSIYSESNGRSIDHAGAGAE